MSANAKSTSLPFYSIVPVAFVRLLFTYIEERGVDGPAVLSAPAPTDTMNPLDAYPAQQYCEMLERASRHLGDPLLGLHLGQTMRMADLGPIGYILASCGTVAEALFRLLRYKHLLHATNDMIVRPESHHIVLEWPVTPWYYGRLFDEMGVTVIIQFAREMAGVSDAVSRVEFTDAEPPSIQPYIEQFGGDVLFNQPATKLYFPSSLLAHTLPSPDPDKLALLEYQIEALLGQSVQPDEIERSTRRIVAKLAHKGVPTLELVASELNLSPRKLSRKLGDQGLNFRQLREDTLRKVAEKHIADPGLTLTEVALLLGYSEQSAFSRAFARWTGQSPRQWRKSITSSSSGHPQ